MAHTGLADTFGLLTYTDNGTSITITGYPSNEVGALDIPASIVGKPVTSIGSSAFRYCSGVTNVTIPSSVTSIGSYAFSSCSGLTSVTIPSGVTSIGTSAFSSCGGLRSMTISSSVTSIGSSAFASCRGLTSVTIPSSVTSIGSSAFSSCSGLTSVTIPSSVTSIGNHAFSYCYGLTTITVEPTNGAYSSEDGVLFNKSMAVIIQCPVGKTGTCLIPSSVTSIESFAFSSCSGLTSVTIPSSVTSIGSGAFTNCYGLTSVTIPSSVTSIGSDAFTHCSGLTSVTIPSSVTSIPSEAFAFCSGITEVTIPSSVTSIGDVAFSRCSSLRSVIIPSSVTSIGSSAFKYCSSLSSALFLGNSPSIIPNNITGQSFALNAIDFKVYFFEGKSGFIAPTWKGYPSVNMGEPSVVSTWLISNGYPHDTDLNADSDGDGVSLLLAYAFNLDPKQNLSARMPQPVIASSQMSLIFYAGSEDVSYAVESSSDLQIWSTAGVSLSVPDANKFRSASVSTSDPVRFMRIKVSYIPNSAGW